METETAEITIEKPVDDVWSLVGDFAEMSWMKGVDSVTVDDDVRTVSMGGAAIKEQLVNLDEDEHRLTYSIIEGPVPIDSHQATISVIPAGDGCMVTWSVTSEPDGTAAFFHDVYSGALKALKEKAES